MDNASALANAPVIRMEDVAIGSLQDVGAVVVEQIDWTVSAGDYWVVAGLQGSGKSDFLMTTGGVMAPLNGRYWLLGEEMPVFDEARLHHRLRLGVVFDGGQLFNHLTVRENIALAPRYHRNLTAAAADEEVRQLMEAMELLPWADSTPGAIGRNWQTRVGLARALSLRPEVLLVDNPLAGLDLRHVYWWLSFLGELSRGHALLKNQPLTLVVTTADLRPWKDRARQFAILRNRRLTVLGTWEQLQDASTELVHELLTIEARTG
jgi:ABC-type transporter Mla maintaining outer membrane lipid asymmetry ATPase subunit MlaF